MRHSIPATICSFAMLCMLVVSPVVFAAEQPKKNAVDAQFKVMDVNGDGKLSPAEHAAGAKRMFDTMDVNKDGTVTAEEMDAAHEKVTGQKPVAGDMAAAEKIKVVDTNGDGMLTSDEHATGSRKMFHTMDTDQDGFLSHAELTTGHKNLLRKESR